ncbi:MAG: GNAT family N-acetyltransferase [Candidatus Kapaibacterium sp.]|nr:GNAT family N-acetyltransferase [Ignavibacteriota bacterium]
MKQFTEHLNSNHKKAEFSCGVPMLDDYLRKQANQDIKRNLTACFVLTDESNDLLKGYYTLSNNSIPQNKIPTEFQKKLPKSYTSIPTTLLGRLAVDSRYKGQGLGKLLLVDALYRSYEISSSVGSYAVVVDPIDQSAVEFYSKYGFILLPDSGKMFLPMQTIKSLFV